MAVTYKNPSLAMYVEDSLKTISTDFDTNRKLQFLRLVNEDLNTQFSREESNEIRGDAQSSGSVITSASGAGTISIQYSLDSYDEMLAGVLFSEYATSGTQTAGIQARDWGWNDESPSAVTTTGVSWSFSADTLTLLSTNIGTVGGLALGDTILITGSGSQNLDGVWRVATAGQDDGSGNVDVELVNDTGETDIATYLDVTSGSAIVITEPDSSCRNGTNDVTFGLVRSYTDTSDAGDSVAITSPDWAQFRGAYMTSLQLSVAPGQAGWTGTFSVLFSDEQIISAPTQVHSSLTNWDNTMAPNNNPLPDAINGVAQIMVRNKRTGAKKRHDALSMNVNISNNSEEVQALRNRGALCVNQGTLSATLDMELIYEGSLFHTAMLDDDAFEIEFAIKDSDGKAQLWRFPKCRMTSERPNPGKNAPIVQTLNFVAEAGGTPFGSTHLVNADSTDTKMVEVVRFYGSEAY